MFCSKFLISFPILCMLYKVLFLDQMSLKYLFLTCLLMLWFISMLFLFLSSYYIQKVSRQKSRDADRTSAKDNLATDDCPFITAELNQQNESNGSYQTTKNCKISYTSCESLKLPCIYGDYYNITCTDTYNNTFRRAEMCRYCYQTEHWEHNCTHRTNCGGTSYSRKHYRANCTVHNYVICLGSRHFEKKERCNWTKGYRWSTALTLSITVGGFGVDRFYLGHWQEGIGKLFSFGGLGIWTLIDILLIAIRYLGPEDSSMYI